MTYITRRTTKPVAVGKVTIGGDAPIVIQSMTITDTRDAGATADQINQLAEAGCQVVRVAVPDMKAAKALGDIRRRIRVPLISDIHFDYRLALEALEQGVDKLRLNPGNIRKPEQVREVCRKALERKVPIRIGVNAGSLAPELLEKYGWPTPEALVESALWEIGLLESEGFDQIIISIKSHEVPATIRAYQLLAEKTDYPFHVGITEAGPLWPGTIRSAIGIGTLLALGIGDTIRVSLTAEPVEEVKVAKEMLKVLEIREEDPTIISCPTCGRLEVDLFSLVKQVEERVAHLKEPIKIAVMGCVVNGPGESRGADVGVAAGKGAAVIFRKGELKRRVTEAEILDALNEEIDEILAERKTTAAAAAAAAL